MTGNVSFTTTASGTITLGAGTLTGNLTVTTPNASFESNATVNGTTTINDVADRTFTNNGALVGSVTVEDDNGTRFVNNGTITLGLTLNTPGAVILEGTYNTPVSITANAQVTVPEGSTVNKINVESDNATISNNGSIESIATLPAYTAPTVTGTEPTKIYDLAALENILAGSGKTVDATTNKLNLAYVTIGEDVTKIVATMDAKTKGNNDYKITWADGEIVEAETATDLQSVEDFVVNMPEAGGNIITFDFAGQLKNSLTEDEYNLNPVYLEVTTTNGVYKFELTTYLQYDVFGF